MQPEGTRRKRTHGVLFVVLSVPLLGYLASALWFFLILGLRLESSLGVAMGISAVVVFLVWAFLAWALLLWMRARLTH